MAAQQITGEAVEVDSPKNKIMDINLLRYEKNGLRCNRALHWFCNFKQMYWGYIIFSPTIMNFVYLMICAHYQFVAVIFAALRWWRTSYQTYVMKSQLHMSYVIYRFCKNGHDKSMDRRKPQSTCTNLGYTAVYRGFLLIFTSMTVHKIVIFQ